MKNFLLGALLTGALCLSPTMLHAQDHEHDQDRHDSNIRTYQDTAHHDEHQWNDSENSNWSKYREEHHIKQNDFSHASRKQQQAYWNWRHEHGDNH